MELGDCLIRFDSHLFLSVEGSLQVGVVALKTNNFSIIADHEDFGTHLRGFQV